MIKEEYIQKIKRKYSYMDECDIEDLYFIARELLLNVLDPMHSVFTDVPSFHQYTLLSLMYEMRDLSGISSFTSYRENGVQWVRDTTAYSVLAGITPYGA